MQGKEEVKEPKRNLLDRTIAAFSPGWAARRAKNRMIIEFSDMYKSATATQLRANWSILGTSQAQTPDKYEQDVLRNRARDAIRNDPIASGAQETFKTNIVGSGLNPQSGIRAKVLGISEERAEQLRTQAELIFQRWKAFADSQNRLDFDECQFIAMAKVIEDGESIIIPTWAREKWRPFARCIEILESDRLSTPSELIKEIKYGIKTGSRGQPKSYFIRKPNEKSNKKSSYNEIPAFDPLGRPKILHIFNPKRPGQMRGIPMFAPVLTYFKDLADYLEAEIVAARVAACLAVFITKTDPLATQLSAGTVSASDASKRYQSLEPGMVGYLNTGESINTVAPNRPGDTFSDFVEQLLRMIGVAIQMPYELIAKDFSKTNYSSARAALLEGRRSFITWRTWLAKKLCQPIYNLVLEEAYLRGEFEVSDFYKWKQEYCRAGWIGQGWGWVDPAKEVQSSKDAVAYNLSTLAEEAASQGRSWEEVLEQRARERAKAKELDVPDVADENIQQELTENAESQEE